MSIIFARQAIYNRAKEVCFYELVFGDKKSNGEYNKELEEKRVKFICSYGATGLNNFTNNKKVFTNFTTISIMEDIPDLLGKENIVVTITKNVVFSREIVEMLEELSKKGFTIAYSNYNGEKLTEALASIIDIFMIDFNNKSIDEIKKIISIVKEYNFKSQLLGSNIDSEEEYKFTYENNFSYFEGEFFSKPIIIKEKNILVKNSNRFNIIVELLKDDFDIERVEYIIKSDLSISYKLMRFLNSAAFGFPQKINSIKHAIMLLGKEELRKWLTLIVVSGMQDEENEELVNNIIIRARFCELVAKMIVSSKSSLAFIVGLFSDLDMFMGRDIKELVEELQLDEQVKNALIGESNVLKDILDLVKSYEKMEVKKVKKYSSYLKIDEIILFELYSESIDWLNETNINVNK